jgi:hypothetical protein
VNTLSLGVDLCQAQFQALEPQHLLFNWILHSGYFLLNSKAVHPVWRAHTTEPSGLTDSVDRLKSRHHAALQVTMQDMY